METTFKDFYDTLIENLETYTGEYESFIDYGPDLFKLLCDLLNSDVDRSLKLPICGAIAYYVAPEDIISEQIYGPYGYIDDIYLSSYVLKMVGERHGYEFIQQKSSLSMNVKRNPSKYLVMKKSKVLWTILDFKVSILRCI